MDWRRSLIDGRGRKDFRCYFWSKYRAESLYLYCRGGERTAVFCVFQVAVQYLAVNKMSHELNTNRLGFQWSSSGNLPLMPAAYLLSEAAGVLVHGGSHRHFYLPSHPGLPDNVQQKQWPCCLPWKHHLHWWHWAGAGLLEKTLWIGSWQATPMTN